MKYPSDVREPKINKLYRKVATPFAIKCPPICRVQVETTQNVHKMRKKKKQNLQEERNVRSDTPTPSTTYIGMYTAIAQQ